ncbi:amino acid ABC transporter permease [Gaiella sp.]|uniref:amino acid ABC transporter permease n=1 Tax=Gaiella sp. TaxID=2663207 RepID=UPI0032631034
MTVPDWVTPVAEYIFREGLRETLRLAAIAVVASTALGILLGTLLTIRSRPLRAMIRLYVEVWRGLPIIVTIFLLYFALPGLVDIRLDAFAAGAIGLTLWGSAQVAEATRGAVESITKDQHEAAAALGFGWLGRHRYVILPQALRRLLPPLVGLQVNVIQNTTIAAVIGVAEVLEAGNRSVERLTFSTAESHAFEIFAFVMVIFFVISFPLTRLSAYLERRLV